MALQELNMQLAQESCAKLLGEADFATMTIRGKPFCEEGFRSLLETEMKAGVLKPADSRILGDLIQEKFMSCEDLNGITEYLNTVRPCREGPAPRSTRDVDEARFAEARFERASDKFHELMELSKQHRQSGEFEAALRVMGKARFTLETQLSSDGSMHPLVSYQTARIVSEQASAQNPLHSLEAPALGCH